MNSVTFFFEVSTSIETNDEINDLSDVINLCPELKCENADEVGDVTYIVVHDKNGNIIQEWSL